MTEVMPSRKSTNLGAGSNLCPRCLNKNSLASCLALLWEQFFGEIGGRVLRGADSLHEISVGFSPARDFGRRSRTLLHFTDTVEYRLPEITENGERPLFHHGFVQHFPNHSKLD